MNLKHAHSVELRCCHVGNIYIRRSSVPQPQSRGSVRGGRYFDLLALYLTEATALVWVSLATAKTLPRVCLQRCY